LVFLRSLGNFEIYIDYCFKISLALVVFYRKKTLTIKRLHLYHCQDMKETLRHYVF